MNKPTSIKTHSHILKATCNIENCDVYYDYNEHHDDMRALEAEWVQPLPVEDREPISIKLWGEQPKLGQVYDIKIMGVVKLDVAKPFWVFYQDPVVWEDGFDSEEAVFSLELCLCEYIRTRHDISTKKLALTIKIIKRLNFEDICGLPSSYCLNSNMESEIYSDYATLYKFENYYIAETNYQGNCGATYIIEKVTIRKIKGGQNEPPAYILRLQNSWEFHESVWSAPNRELDFMPKSIHLWSDL